MEQQAESALGKRVAEVLEVVASSIGVPATVTVSEGADGIVAEYQGEDLALVIGRHGATIDAIQHLAYRIAFHGAGEHQRLSVDAGGYRARRAEALHGIAEQAAQTAVREHRPVALEPMSAQERKVVHQYLKDRAGIETYSEGQEPTRRLVVAPLEG